MIFTIPILVAAIRYGRNAALATSILAVLAFDFFFIPPRFTFTVGDARHIGTFAILLGMGLVIGNLTERVRQQAIRAQLRGTADPGPLPAGGGPGPGRGPGGDHHFGGTGCGIPVPDQGDLLPPERGRSPGGHG